MKESEFPDSVVEEAMKSPLFSFPCFTCPNMQEQMKWSGIPRCDNYTQCGLWINWAKQEALKN